jgi:hypothetical protein
VGHHCGRRARSSPSDRNPNGHLTGLTHALARMAVKFYFQRGVRIARLKRRRPNKYSVPVAESRLHLPKIVILPICCCSFEDPSTVLSHSRRFIDYYLFPNNPARRWTNRGDLSGNGCLPGTSTIISPESHSVAFVCRYSPQ